MLINDMKNILVFVTSAELESFTKAAEKLHLTKSAVSKIIAKLEMELGVVLFNRTTRNLVLTTEGSIFFEYGQRAINEIETAQTLIDSEKRYATGLLRVSVPVIFGKLYIAPLFQILSQEQQQLRIELSFNDRRVDLIDDNFDLAIRIGTLPDNSNLIGRNIGQHSMVVCASSNYFKNNDKPISLNDIQKLPTIAYTRAGLIQKWKFLDSSSNIIEIKPNSRFMMDDMQAILECVLDANGLAWLPSWLVQPYIDEGKLIQVFEDIPSLSFPISAVWKKSAYLPLRIRVAIDKLMSEK